MNNNVSTKVMKRNTFKRVAVKTIKRTFRTLFETFENASSFLNKSTKEFNKVSYKKKAIIIVGMMLSTCSAIVVGIILFSITKSLFLDIMAAGQFFAAAIMYLLDGLLGWIIRPTLTLILSIGDAVGVFFNQIAQLF